MPAERRRIRRDASSTRDRTSAARRGPPTTGCATRPSNQAWTIDPADPSAAPVKVEGAAPAAAAVVAAAAGGAPVADARVAPGRAAAARALPVPTARGPSCCATNRSRARRAGADGLRASVTRSASRASTFDWMEFQRDGQPFPAPNPDEPSRAAARPCRPSGRRRRRGRSSTKTSGPPGSSGIRPGSCWRSSPTPTWRDETEVRASRSLDGDDRRQGHAADRRRLRPRRSRFLAGRQVPVLRADVRHRHDHPAEAESWRPARSVRASPSTAADRSTSPRSGISSPGDRAGRRTAASSTSRAATGGETHLFRVSVPAGGRSSRSPKASAGSTA